MKRILLLHFFLVLFLFSMAHSVQAESKALYDYHQGLAMGAQGKFAAAREFFEEALKKDPLSNPSLRGISLLKDLERGRIKGQTAVYLFQAFSAFNHYRLESALQNLNRAAELDSDYSLIYAHRADIYLEQGHSREALADYNKALELDSGYAAGYVNRGIYFARQSQFDRAITDFNQAIALEPQNIPAYYSRANVYGDQRRFEAAIVDYNKILSINPHYPHAYVRKGLVFEKTGRLREALAAYTAYLQNLNLSDQDPNQVKWVQDKVKSLEKQLQ